MIFLYSIAFLSLMLCSSCGREFSVKPKPSPYSIKQHTQEQTLDKTTMSPKEYRRKLREKTRKQYALMSKHPKNMSYDELKQAKDILLASDDKTHAPTYIERMIVMGNDLSELKDLRLEIADVYFDLGDLNKAESFYGEFVSLYPGSNAIEYVEYKAILCSFYQTLTSEFDQSKTQQTIKLSQDFLNKKNYRHYSIDVASVKKECMTTLFDSEVNIINFYINKNKLNSAQQRLAQLKEKFSSLASVSPTILTLEYELAKKQGNKELVLEKQKSLEHMKEKYSPVLAQHSDKKSYAKRF